MIITAATPVLVEHVQYCILIFQETESVTGLSQQGMDCI